MVSNSTGKPGVRANRSVEEDNARTQEQQQTETTSDQDNLENDRMPYTTTSSKSEHTSEHIDSLRYASQRQDDATPPSEVYDQESPKPSLLVQEDKHATVSEREGDPNRRESRLANAENVLSWKSIFCWSLVTIVLVGGSLTAVIVTVDWSVTANGDAAADITNKRGNFSFWKQLLDGQLAVRNGKHAQMEHMNLEENSQLSGTIPTALFNVTLLSYFDVTGCVISGRIPTEVGISTSLTFLDVSKKEGFGW
ncbi:MAG: hypothetical protein SGBAC_007191 [Bacillariaceae sp.]